MAAVTAPPLLAPGELATLLREFAEAPGNFLVRLGEPKALHAQLDTVAAWAVGRTPPELSDQGEALRDAAVLFVLRACFAPENTHYQVLGISPKSLTAEGLRTRYRALIRLTHPDMAVKGLPANAAGIVNRANEVLGDPELRSRYDDLLASRKVLAPLEPGAAVVPQIELRASVRERWQSLVARFPTAVWAVPTALGAGTLGLGLLVWASTASTDSRGLIVARADGQDRDARPADKAGKVGEAPKPPRTSSVAPWPAPAVERSPRSTATANSPAPPAPYTPTSLTRASTRDAADGREPSAASPDAGRQEPGAGKAASSHTPARGSVPEAPAAPAPASTVAAAATRSDKDSAAAAQGRSEPGFQAQPPAPAAAPPVARPPAPAVTSAASPTPVPAPATVLATTAATQATLAATPPPPAPSPAPATAAFNVDAGRAKSYLAELIMSLERPSRARQNNSYLSDMNVQGSLLQPALQLMRRFPDVAVEHMNWNDSQRPGAMKLQGVVVVRAKNPDTGEAKRVNFRLNAEFWGTKDGTVMASLNLREDD